MRRPTPEDFDTAAEWLDVNEGEQGEAESCQLVAKWLHEQASSAEVRALAKEIGVSTAIARKAMESVKREETS